MKNVSTKTASKNGKARFLEDGTDCKDFHKHDGFYKDVLFYDKPIPCTSFYKK